MTCKKGADNSLAFFLKSRILPFEHLLCACQLRHLPTLRSGEAESSEFTQNYLYTLHCGQQRQAFLYGTFDLLALLGSHGVQNLGAYSYGLLSSLRSLSPSHTWSGPVHRRRGTH